MKILKLPILLLFLPGFCLFAYPNQIGDTLQVWAKTGLNLRAEPSPQGQIITTLQPGTKVVLKETTDKYLSINLFPDSDADFLIHGRWVYISSGDENGYVFDAYLMPNDLLVGKSMADFITQNVLHSDTIIYNPSAVGESTILRAKMRLRSNISYEVFNSGVGSKRVFLIEDISIQQAFIFINYFVQIHLPDLNLLPPVIFEYNSEELLIGNSDICQLRFEYIGGAVQITYHCSC